MAKLYFRYGAVSSAKTLNLLAVAHNYRSQGKNVILIKPSLDDRFDVKLIKSRAGLEITADILLFAADSAAAVNLLQNVNFAGVSCVLVDEVQFLSDVYIEQFREIATQFDVPVICYGLRTDFKSRLFPASKRLFELCDNVEEVKSTCTFCNRKSVMSLKHVDGKAVFEGPSIDLGFEEKYFPACYACYKREILRAEKRPDDVSLFTQQPPSSPSIDVPCK